MTNSGILLGLAKISARESLGKAQEIGRCQVRAWTEVRIQRVRKILLNIAHLSHKRWPLDQHPVHYRVVKHDLLVAFLFADRRAQSAARQKGAASVTI